MLEDNPYRHLDSIATSEHRGETKRATAMASWFGFLGPLLVQSMLGSACGHLDLFALPITLAIVAFAFNAYRKPSSRTLIGLAGLAFAVLFLGKHLGDILWLGHEPLVEF